MGKEEKSISRRDENLIYIAEEIRHLHIILIHPSTAFLIHPDLEDDIYRIQDNRLYNPLEWKDPIEYYDVFYENIRNAIETKKSTILLIFNPAIAICTGALQDLFKSWKIYPVTCLYFFNNNDPVDYKVSYYYLLQCSLNAQGKK